jgi:hypothetical protein
VSLTLVKTRDGNDAVYQDLCKVACKTETQGYDAASDVQEVPAIEDEWDVGTAPRTA